MTLLLALLLLILVTVMLVAVLRSAILQKPEAAESSAGYSFSYLQKDEDARVSAYIDSKSAIGVWKDELNSTNAILVNNTKNEILYVKDAYERIYPASITKVMTAVVAIDKIDDTLKKITLSDEMFKYIEEQNASVAGFEPRENVTFMDMMYALLLPSGADAAIGLAMDIAGSEEEFAVLMNEKAAEIGMNSTNFVNSTGLHDDDHYSTVYDLALLMRYALKYPLFRQISSADTYTTTSTKQHPGGIILSNTIFRSISASGRSNNYIAGGKTGYTLEALQCLASYAYKESNEYILVTVGAGADDKKKQWHVVDALNVYSDYAD